MEGISFSVVQMGAHRGRGSRRSGQALGSPPTSQGSYIASPLISRNLPFYPLLITTKLITPKERPPLYEV
ncbi:hypothetical protein CL673_05715 [Candidatus Bathyarchaeota archaeon]|nr:hypothetical protein [Candidatus Bathyarchaeota archaeon]